MSDIESSPSIETQAPNRAVSIQAVSIEVFSSMEAIEPQWRALEARAHASPFQRFAWVASYVRTVSAASGAQPVLVLVHDASGAPAAILPLETSRRGAITTLRGIGGKHASFQLPLATPEGAALIAADPLALLRQAARIAGGADLVSFMNQPAAWAGIANPFASLGVGREAGRAYETALTGDAEAFIKEKSSGDARKKLRKKRQALDKIGAVAASRATMPADIAATLDAFLAQKERRFASQGIANPFADAATRAFLRRACDAGAGEAPAIDLYRLVCGERIVAVFGLATGFGRASGMFTSFDDDPAIARCSPGDILLGDMIRDLVARGFTEFDLGVGDARYKNAFCDRQVELTQIVVPLTLRGRAISAGLRTALWAKALVKRDPRLLRAANRVRALFKRGD